MKNILLIATLALLGACASQGPDYQRAHGSGSEGYSDTQLTKNQYRVSYVGGHRTDAATVKDFALLRAAELTLLNGHDWFRVMNQDTATEAHSRPETQTSLAHTTQVHQSCGLLGCTTSVSPAYSTIEVVSTRDSESFSTTIDISMGDGEVDDPTTVYNATELRAFLADKYGDV
ncbi:MAG: hypothetical protein KDI19_02040 [Pseudomonadales bacterium]|nr:hypothetical protein [Pseudomonadales bacterium]